MNKKILIALVAVFVVLAAVASAPLWSGPLEKAVGLGGGAGGGKGLTSGPAVAVAPIALAGFNESDATQVVIAGNGQTLTLERVSGSWTVKGVPPPPPDTSKPISKKRTAKGVTSPSVESSADIAQPAKEDALKALFTALSGTTVGDLVAKNPANHAVLGVTAQAGYTLTLEQGNSKLDLIIGNPTAAGDSFYLRTKDSDNVYTASGSLRQLLTQPATDWVQPPPAPTPAPATGTNQTPIKKKVPSAI